MVDGSGEKATDPVTAVKRSYERGITDEFIESITIVDNRHEPVGLIREGDACIFFNYRADRGREMTQVLSESNLKLHFTTMTQYDKSLAVPFVLSREHLITSWPTSWGPSTGRICASPRRRNTRTSRIFQRRKREAVSR